MPDGPPLIFFDARFAFRCTCRCCVNDKFSEQLRIYEGQRRRGANCLTRIPRFLAPSKKFLVSTSHVTPFPVVKMYLLVTRVDVSFEKSRLGTHTSGEPSAKWP
jgi:hypothetical protein